MGEVIMLSRFDTGVYVEIAVSTLFAVAVCCALQVIVRALEDDGSWVC